MASSPALPPEIDQALARGYLVLTANQRAARTLRYAFDLHQRALGCTYWEPPFILAWDSWMESLWHSLLLDGHASDLLLSSVQEHTLWRAIIAAEAAASLRPLDSLAQTASKAWLLLHAYQGRRRLNAFPGNGDTRTFARWATEFERRCTRSQYLTQAQLPQTLRDAVSAGQLNAPLGILLVGFDLITPAQTALLDALRTAGTSIDELAHILPHHPASLVSAPDEHTELAACARWLRAQLTDQPNARIAIIVPAIEPARAEIDRILRQVLAAELNHIAAPTGSGPYEFSLGVPLAQTPLVAAALDVLRWVAGPLPIDRVSALLLSPHFAAANPDIASELLARAEFDAFDLRRQHRIRPEISPGDLASLATRSRLCPQLPGLLHHLRALRPAFYKKEFGGERTHADWAATIHDLLEAAGWAPAAQLDSIEFQTCRKWEDALDELASLDFGGVRVSFRDALAALERIAADTLFAPQSRHAPIQIMGPLESAGSRFDALWFLRAGDLAWPTTPAPNPLLPWGLQRDLAMPGASPTRDAALARRTTERIAASAPTVVFSYAEQSDDGQQRPSPALAGFTGEPISASGFAPAPPPEPDPIALDLVSDDTPIPPPPDRVLQGGAAILKSQAECGFRAFAEKRLFSSALESIALGLDPRERGSLVHAVLESFWAEVQTQAALQQMNRDQREDQLNRSIDVAFAKHHSRVETGWSTAYLGIERQRLLNLLHPWLDYEATMRSPFAVKSREQELKGVPIGPLRLDVRVDRIDLALSDGEPAGEIILDYKTGLAKPADWLGPRPDEPQLPLYAVLSNQPQLAAIAFANIRAGDELGLCGFQARDGVLPKAAKLQAESLAAQVEEWREVLTRLAEDFHAGQTSVSPKRYPGTCKYCQQRLLCRLDPATLNPVFTDLEEYLDSDPNADPDLFETSSYEADLG
jgi:probable DNA repair protein